MTLRLTILVVCVGMPTTLLAQAAERRATLADVPSMTDGMFADAFANIPLSAADSDKARQIIRRERTAQVEGFRSPIRQGGQAYALAAARDSALLRLLHSAADSAKYRENIEPYAIPRPRTP